MGKTCWNCGIKATEYISSYANHFCSQCADIFREEAKKYNKEGKDK